MSAEIVEIKSISKQIRGVSYTPKDVSSVPLDSHIRLLRANNITENGIDLTDTVYVNKKCISETQKLKVGDILIAASSGSINIVGKAILIENEINCSFGAFCKVIRPNEKVDYRYLSFYFRSSHYRQKISHLAAGANINNLRNEDIDTLQIPLPPLATQKRIAEILDAADALRHKDQELLKKYDELAQAIFIEMFGDPVKNEKGWEVIKLADLLSQKSKNGLYVTKENYSVSEGIEMVHMSDAFYGKVTQGKLKKVIIPEKEAIKYKLTDNDILIARRSLNYEGAVKPCLIRTNGKIMVYESSLIRIVVDKSKLHPLYLFYFLNNEKAKKEYVLKYVTKSTISGINNENLNKIEVIVPNVDLQYLFNDRVLELDKILGLNSIKIGNELFNSLIQKAFKGELVA
jgi:type I restriction enzyme S subunit